MGSASAGLWRRSAMFGGRRGPPVEHGHLLLSRLWQFSLRVLVFASLPHLRWRYGDLAGRQID